MAGHVFLVAEVFHGITPIQLSRLAYEYAEKNNVKHSFNRFSRLAGPDWLYGFLKRKQSISIRKPEPTSLNRVLGFNEEQVKTFYANLTEVITLTN